jgi:hypothetical protein
MRKISVVIALLALVACGGKKDDKGGTQGGAEGSGAAAAPADKPITCPPGNVVKDGACLAVITAEKVAVVTQQQSRLDELAKLLDKVDTVAVPIELMGSLRQLDPWKTYVGKSEKLKLIDAGVASLDDAVKQLRVFKGGLEQASAGLGNLKGELDRILHDTGATRRIEEVRAQVSSQIRTTVQPLAKQVTDAIQGALAPLAARFEDAANLVTAGCAVMALGRAGDKSKETCTKATEAFGQAKQYVADLKGRPAALFDEIAGKLETELAALLDDQAKQLLDTAQAAVNDALKLPAAGAGAAAAGAGSAAAP